MFGISNWHYTIRLQKGTGFFSSQFYIADCRHFTDCSQKTAMKRTTHWWKDDWIDDIWRFKAEKMNRRVFASDAREPIAAGWGCWLPLSVFFSSTSSNNRLWRSAAIIPQFFIFHPFILLSFFLYQMRRSSADSSRFSKIVFATVHFMLIIILTAIFTIFLNLTSNSRATKLDELIIVITL